MNTFNAIEKSLITYVRNSGVKVTINYRMNWVEIILPEADSWLFQGWEALEFIREVEDIWDRGEIFREDAELLAAYSYVTAGV